MRGLQGNRDSVRLIDAPLPNIYLPVNLGGRFSINARGPSFASSVFIVNAAFSRSIR